MTASSPHLLTPRTPTCTKTTSRWVLTTSQSSSSNNSRTTTKTVWLATYSKEINRTKVGRLPQANWKQKHLKKVYKAGRVKKLAPKVCKMLEGKRVICSSRPEFLWMSSSSRLNALKKVRLDSHNHLKIAGIWIERGLPPWRKMTLNFIPPLTSFLHQTWSPLIPCRWTKKFILTWIPIWPCSNNTSITAWRTGGKAIRELAPIYRGPNKLWNDTWTSLKFNSNSIVNQVVQRLDKEPKIFSPKANHWHDRCFRTQIETSSIVSKIPIIIRRGFTLERSPRQLASCLMRITNAQGFLTSNDPDLPSTFPGDAIPKTWGLKGAKPREWVSWARKVVEVWSLRIQWN